MQVPSNKKIQTIYERGLDYTSCESPSRDDMFMIYIKHVRQIKLDYGGIKMCQIF